MGATRLFIHIGTHKTGTTTIQYALRNNAEALRNENLIYLSIPASAHKLMNRIDVDDHIISQCRDELNQAIAIQQKDGDFHYIWSWEGFSGSPNIGYENACIVAESLKKITIGFDVQIIVYLRRQDDFIQSLYTQKIMEGESYTFESFLHNYSSVSFNWERLLRCYAASFGKDKIIARRYDGALFDGPDSLLKDFANILGSKSLFESTINIERNRGYSGDALEIARLTNPYLTRMEKNRLRQILQQTNARPLDENYSLLTNDQRKEFLRTYLESNANVARRYFHDSPSTLFSTSDLDNTREAYQGISLENAIIVLTKAMLAQQVTLTPKVEKKALVSLEQSVLLKAERKILLMLNKFPFVKSTLNYLHQKFLQ